VWLRVLERIDELAKRARFAGATPKLSSTIDAHWEAHSVINSNAATALKFVRNVLKKAIRKKTQEHQSAESTAMGKVYVATTCACVCVGSLSGAGLFVRALFKQEQSAQRRDCET
jgi:hypothetical protein